MLAMATMGFAVNFWAWALISPLGPLFRANGSIGTLSESDVALRMHFYLDHDWMTELGEGLPVYRPPLNMAALFSEPALGNLSDGSSVDGVEQVEGLTVRYLTPHNKWSIHSEYQEAPA